MQEACEKITIKELPLSVTNSEVENYLRENNMEIVSPIRYSKEIPSKSNKDSPKSQEKVELSGAVCQPKHGAITNIKDFLQKQKGSTKRKFPKHLRRTRT